MKFKTGAKTAAFVTSLAVAALATATPVFAKAKAAPAAKDPSMACPASQIQHNKELARLFDMKLDWRNAYASMDPGYIQHNPIAKRIGEVNNAPGRDEFKLLMELKGKGFGGQPPALPGQPPEDTYYFVMATCDHVFLMKKSYQPDPVNKGKFYEAFSFDLWRVKDGKLAEHWDDGRIPANPPAVMTTPVAELLKAGPPKGPSPSSTPSPGQPPNPGALPGQ